MRPNIIIAINTAWNLVNFRVGLMRALQAEGYAVLAVSPDDAYASELKQLGFRHVVMPMDNRGTNPFKDLWLFWRMLRLMQQEKPAVYLGYTIKPNIYGALAARCLGIPVINNISGLGATFIDDGLMTKLVKRLYWLALRQSHCVFFQNRDDRELFVAAGIVRPQLTALLPGSGIDLQHFDHCPMPASRAPFRFLLVARMLWDKGVGEYVAAAHTVRAQYPEASFGLLGFVGVPNPKAISTQQMALWTATSGIEYLGETSDVRPYIEAAHCVVLPSYREGTPRSLLEAAAMGRPIIATDVPGCREVVDHGVNGYLCEVRNADDLAQQMLHLLSLDDAALAAMGTASRAKAVRQFDEQIVIDCYVHAIHQALKPENVCSAN